MTFSRDILHSRLGTHSTALAVIFAMLTAFSGCDQNSGKKDGEKKDSPSGNVQKSATEKRIEEIEKKIGEISEETDDPTKLIEYCEGLYEDPNPQVTELAAGLMVNINVKQLQAGAPDATKHLKRAVDVLIDRESVGPLHLALAQEAAGWIERDNQIELAKSLWKKIEEKFTKHENSEIAEKARDVVDRARRRTGMLGSELELSGSLARGGELDWSKYKGKVVLVDFWATWCPPCIAEMPHLKRLYDKYQEQGFVILGISLDSDETDGTATTMTAKDKVLQFLNDRDLPWDSVYFADEKDQGWENPIANKYGIGGLPQGVLVGRDGKVIAYNALGEELDVLLEKEFKVKPEEKKRTSASSLDVIPISDIPLPTNRETLRFLRWANTRHAMFCSVNLDCDEEITAIAVHPCYAVSDDELKEISRLPRVESLSFYAKSLTDNGVQHLETMSALRRLEMVRASNISNDSLKTLSLANTELAIVVPYR